MRFKHLFDVAHMSFITLPFNAGLYLPACLEHSLLASNFSLTLIPTTGVLSYPAENQLPWGIAQPYGLA
jgi:hypothetical protein